MLIKWLNPRIFPQNLVEQCRINFLRMCYHFVRHLLKCVDFVAILARGPFFLTHPVCWGYPRGPYPRIFLSSFPLGVRYLTITVLGKICPFLLTKICENSNPHILYIISHEQMSFTQDLIQPLHFMKNICSQKSVFV